MALDQRDDELGQLGGLLEPLAAEFRDVKPVAAASCVDQVNRKHDAVSVVD